MLCYIAHINRLNECSWCVRIQWRSQHRSHIFFKNDKFKVRSNSVWELCDSEWTKAGNNYSFSRRWFKCSNESVESPLALYDSSSDQTKCQVSVLLSYSGMFQISRFSVSNTVWLGYIPGLRIGITCFYWFGLVFIWNDF